MKIMMKILLERKVIVCVCVSENEKKCFACVFIGGGGVCVLNLDSACKRVKSGCVYITKKCSVALQRRTMPTACVVMCVYSDDEKSSNQFKLLHPPPDGKQNFT